jgi:glutamate dehydrogenase/leucine dehydrogenase
MRTEALTSPESSLAHEQLLVTRGQRSGLTVAIAVHSTARGPAIGGCRIKQYPDWRSGIDDVLRLSEAMTLKCALADVPHGGGKTVAVLPCEVLTAERHRALIADISEAIGALDGRYLTGPDIGSTPADMAMIYDRTGGLAFCRPEHLGGSGNSSVATARGVLAALAAGIRHVFAADSAAGLRVGIIGVGSVGQLIGQALARDGAQVIATDIDAARRDVAESSGLTWASDDLLQEQLDVLVPAATGGLLTEAAVESLNTRLIVGPANNQLADDAVATRLRDKGIVWIPDVIASAGGIIRAVFREELHTDETATNAKIDAIGAKVAHILHTADTDGTTTLHAAQALVETGHRPVEIA